MEELVTELEKMVDELEESLAVEETEELDKNAEKRYQIEQVYLPVLMEMLNNVEDISRVRFAEQMIKGEKNQLETYCEEKVKDIERLLAGAKSKKRKAILEEDYLKVQYIQNYPEKFFEKYMRKNDVPTKESVGSKLDSTLLESFKKLGRDQDWSFVINPESDPVKFEIWTDWIYGKNNNYGEILQYAQQKAQFNFVKDFQEFMENNKASLVSMGERFSELNREEAEQFIDMMAKLKKAKPYLSEPISFSGQTPQEQFKAALPSIEHIERIILDTLYNLKTKMTEIETRIPSEQLEKGAFLGRSENDLSTSALHANRMENFAGSAKDVFQKLTKLSYLIQQFKQSKDLILAAEIKETMETEMQDMIRGDLDHLNYQKR